MTRVRRIVPGMLLLLAAATIAASQPAIPAALAEMVEAERAFAQRSQEVGSKQAFLDFFADTAVGFASGTPKPAKDEILQQPDPPKDLEFWWEPRYGDIAASGELGYLTGPVRSRRASRDEGRTRHGNYASIWKRQADGTFKVVIDIGINPPGEVPFAPGFTRAPFEPRFADSQIAPLAEASLLAADRALVTAAHRSAADAYAAVLAPAARVHRNGHLPFTSRDAAVAWLRGQPPLTEGEPLYAEAARSADLGYTWGRYVTAPGADGQPERGHYARVWLRDQSSTWRVVLDLTVPAPQ